MSGIVDILFLNLHNVYLFLACSEAVQVSYTKDPSCFWVQRCADSRKLTSITDAINKWCRSKEAQVDRHIPIEQGTT